MPKVGIETVTGASNDDVFTQVTGRTTGTRRALDVSVTDASGNQVTTFGGTQYTEGDTDTTITGVAALTEGPSDTLTPLQTDSSKNLKVAIQGTPTVDTELPAAAALADATANPTAPAVAAHNMGYNGSTWDRSYNSAVFDLDTGAGTQYIVGTSLRASASGGSVEVAKLEDNAHQSGDAGIPAWAVANEANTQFAADGDYVPIGVDREGSPRMMGTRAHDAVDAGNPVKIGGKARQSNPTAVADNDRVDAFYDDVGRKVTYPYQCRDLTTHATTAISNSTSETTILAAGAAGVFHDLTFLCITNKTATAVTVTIKDATSGTTRLVLNLAASGQIVMPFPAPINQAAAANNWTATLSAGSIDVDFFVHAIKNV